MKKISEGAEAVIYITGLIGREEVIKYRKSKRYRVKELDDSIRKQRTKTEAKIQAMLYNNGLRVPPIAMAGRYWIAMEKVEGDTLGAVVERGKRGERKARHLAGIFADIGMQLARMHALGIVHGDFTPANIIVDKKGKIWTIDFGLAEFSKSNEERAIDLLLMKRAVRKEDFDAFERSYSRALGEEAKEVLDRMHKIESRGRYQTRTLATS